MTRDMASRVRHSVWHRAHLLKGSHEHSCCLHFSVDSEELTLADSSYGTGAWSVCYLEGSDGDCRMLFHDDSGFAF
ncbi:hypothetical protein E5288_WYG009569 [Bos mutus]|uniref:Uncharacterized protein n=1 Tax=Bos mutus TaxID=72004 RepID=A0A6B0R120_9CETA|nr:hypothetical protein [Bos mutus]